MTLFDVTYLVALLLLRVEFSDVLKHITFK